MRLGMKCFAARAVSKSAPLFLPLILLLVALLGSGCAATRDTQFSAIVAQRTTESRRVAVLPPHVADFLREENLTPESAWWQRLLDGRGGVVTSRKPEAEIRLALIASLSLAGKYRRVFAADSIEEARRLGADSILQCEVYDYRTIVRGANRRYPLSLLLSPVFAPYWMRWLSLEARLDWDVTIYSLTTSHVAFQRRLAQSYYRTTRYSYTRLTDHLLSLLRDDAAPEFIAEMFLLETLSREDLGKKAVKAPPGTAEPVAP